METRIRSESGAGNTAKGTSAVSEGNARLGPGRRLSVVQELAKSGRRALQLSRSRRANAAAGIHSFLPDRSRVARLSRGRSVQHRTRGEFRSRGRQGARREESGGWSGAKADRILTAFGGSVGLAGAARRRLFR